MATKVSERVRITKKLSDGVSYGTRIGSPPQIISFRNEHFAELKYIVNYMTNVIKSFDLNHVFIKDIQDIVEVFASRVWPNNWAICVTAMELKDIDCRLNTLRDYIRDSCLPAMNSKVAHFYTDVINADDHQLFLSDSE